MTSRFPTPSLRHARRLLSLVMVGSLAFPLIAAKTAVAVTIDGDDHELHTYAATVGEALEELDVEVAPVDEVSPPVHASLEDGLEIEVARAVAVDVRVDGELVERVEEPVGSVAGVLEAADLDVREDGALIAPAWTEPVEDGDVIDITMPREVALTVAGETDELQTHVGTVEELLLDQDVDLGDDDLVTPALDEPLDETDEVVIERVEHDEVVEEITLERGEVREETDQLDKGATEVADEGRDGLRRDVYRLEFVDGEEVARELVEQVVVTEPQDRVVRVGTREPEPEPTTPSGSVWDRLAQCESNGNWQANTGNGFHGGLQFHPDTWNRHKPGGYPQYAYQATREQQITVGERVQASQGWGAWPHCSRAIGLR
jgi:resuscitation-promoting factor RpfB